MNSDKTNQAVEATAGRLMNMSTEEIEELMKKPGRWGQVLEAGGFLYDKDRPKEKK